MAEPRPGLVLWAPGTSLVFGGVGLLLVHLFERSDAATQAPLVRAFAVWWPRWFWFGLVTALLSAAWSALPRTSPWRPLLLAAEGLLLLATLLMMVWGIAAGYVFATTMPGGL